MLAVPGLGRRQRRRPLLAPLVLVVGGLVLRSTVVEQAGTGEPLHRAGAAVAAGAGLGGGGGRHAGAAGAGRGLGAGGVLGWLGSTPRELVVLTGLALLLLAPRLPCPRRLARAAGVLASSSLFVYVTALAGPPGRGTRRCPRWRSSASFAVGIAYWWAWSAASRALSSRRRSSRGTGGGSVAA